MNVVEQVKAELARAYSEIPGAPSVTAQRALAGAERALTEFESHRELINWECQRVRRVNAERAERERAETERRAEYLKAVAKVETPKGRKVK